jgi:riboflavin kinase, archaea type
VNLGEEGLGKELEGEVFSGIGRGRYYVGHPEYQRRFESCLGYRPYPGTLNVKLGEKSVPAMRELKGARGVRIERFTFEGEGFSALRCFGGSLSGERVAVLVIDVTHYNETVAELVSPGYLRGKLGLDDGDRVKVILDPLRPGRP